MHVLSLRLPVCMMRPKKSFVVDDDDCNDDCCCEDIDDVELIVDWCILLSIMLFDALVKPLILVCGPVPPTTFRAPTVVLSWLPPLPLFGWRWCECWWWWCWWLLLLWVWQWFWLWFIPNERGDPIYVFNLIWILH